MTGIVVFAIKPDKTTGVTNPFYFYGIHQEIVVLVWLILCLIGSLIFLLNLIKLRLKEFYNIRNNKENNSANTNKITNPLISSENQKNIAAINRYLCFFIYTIISLFLSCSLASWRLINDAQLGVFVILEFLDSILIYGQGIFIFLIIGPQVGVFLIPMKEKISAAYRSFKAKYIPRRRKFRVDETEFEDPSELYLSKIHNEMSPVDFFKAFHLKHAIRNLSHNWSFQSNDDINFQGFTEANFIEWFVLFMSIQDKIPRSYLVPFDIKVEMDTHETLAKIGKCLFDELILNDEFNMNTDFSEKINIYSFKEKNVQL